MNFEASYNNSYTTHELKLINKYWYCAAVPKRRCPLPPTSDDRGIAALFGFLLLQLFVGLLLILAGVLTVTQLYSGHDPVQLFVLHLFATPLVMCGLWLVLRVLLWLCWPLLARLTNSICTKCHHRLL